MNNFKYFLMCVMLPVAFGLIMWWSPEISRLFCTNKCASETQKETPIKSIFNEIISKQDIERFIIAAIIMGIKKFASSHPKTEKTFDNILNTMNKMNTKKKEVIYIYSCFCYN